MASGCRTARRVSTRSLALAASRSVCAQGIAAAQAWPSSTVLARRSQSSSNAGVQARRAVACSARRCWRAALAARSSSAASSCPRMRRSRAMASRTVTPIAVIWAARAVASLPGSSNWGVVIGLASLPW